MISKFKMSTTDHGHSHTNATRHVTVTCAYNRDAASPPIIAIAMAMPTASARGVGIDCTLFEF